MNKPSHCLFKEVRIGQAFRFNGSLWVKSSTRTARLAENDRVFYFGQIERVGL
jgi:hypothetical protein